MAWAYDEIDTPDGLFSVVVDEDGAVVASGWDNVDEVITRLPTDEWPDPAELTRGGELVAAAVAAVRAYYDGDLEAPITFPVAVSGTDLQADGWRELREIEPGSPLTYAEFAAVLGRPTAVRGAARICAANRCGLFIPCHRVVASGGRLAGFAWGLDVKASLLAREAAAR